MAALLDRLRQIGVEPRADVADEGTAGRRHAKSVGRFLDQTVAILAHNLPRKGHHAIRVGAAAYCTKDIEADDLIKLIRRVARGEYLINENVLSRPFVASKVLDQFRELPEADQSSEGVFSPLTPREVEILDYVAQGNSNKEIARILSISDQTVKNHITSILRKLAVNDRTQAVIYALRHGWIRLAEGDEPIEG